MNRTSTLTLWFAVLSAVFFLLLIFFRFPFGPYPLINVQDVLDLLTPLVLIPVYWLLFKNTGRSEAGWVEEIVFMVLAAIWVLGQGMHLSANAINNLSETLAKDQVIDILATDIYKLAYFFDEHLSHYVWHIGALSLAALLIYREWRRPADSPTTWWVTILAGLIYGVTCFAFILEGQTVPMGLPVVVAITLLILIWGRAKLANQPMMSFFFVSFLVTTLLFTGWGLYWGGFPQFTDIGWF